jgi:hypothetical protein
MRRYRQDIHPPKPTDLKFEIPDEWKLTAAVEGPDAPEQERFLLFDSGPAEMHRLIIFALDAGL